MKEFICYVRSGGRWERIGLIEFASSHLAAARRVRRRFATNVVRVEAANTETAESMGYRTRVVRFRRNLTGTTAGFVLV